MMREILKMANTIEEDIKLTANMPSINHEKKLPVLYVKIWEEERQTDRGVKYNVVMHDFYEKAMVTPRLIGRESAES